MYQQLVGGIFGTLERMAAMDIKHGVQPLPLCVLPSTLMATLSSHFPLPGERLRMENYSYLTESVRPLAGVAPSLAPFLAQAEARQVGEMWEGPCHCRRSCPTLGSLCTSLASRSQASWRMSSNSWSGGSSGSFLSSANEWIGSWRCGLT